jgi:uncharacterized repeat protein (TIGR02543 family)
MKKILILILIGFLAACESSALIEDEDVVVEPVVVAPELVEVEVTTYLVRYVIGYSGLIEEQTKEANTVVRLMLPEREGYRFDGWFLDEAFTRPTDRFVTIQSDLDVYAKWIEIIKEPYQMVFDDIRAWFDFESETIHSIEYYVSPSSNQAKADTIYDGMYQAAGLFGPYLKGFDPLSVTVLHPNELTLDKIIIGVDISAMTNNELKNNTINTKRFIFRSPVTKQSIYKLNFIEIHFPTSVYFIVYGF